MITAEQNRLLTQVGPGTAMGGMMRRFWLPVCTSVQLPKPDCPPLRVRLLGENFVAFRNSSGEAPCTCVQRSTSPTKITWSPSS